MNNLNTKNTNKLGEKLSNDNPLLDAKLLSRITDAENGCVYAMQEMYFAFRDGKGAKQDYQIAKQFLNMSFKACDIKPNRELMKADVMTHQIYVEMQIGDVTGMQERFKALLNYQLENLNMDDWNWDAISIVSELYKEYS